MLNKEQYRWFLDVARLMKVLEVLPYRSPLGLGWRSSVD